MRNITKIIIALMLLGLMLIPGYTADDADAIPYFSAPNVLSLRIEEGAATNNPKVRGNILLKLYDGSVIDSDTYTSAGGTISLGLDSSVISPIAPGTAQGQMLFWDNNVFAWVHDEVTEMFWDDTNKSLGIGADSASFISHSYLVVANNSLNKAVGDMYAFDCEVTKTAGASGAATDIWAIACMGAMNQNGGTIGNLGGITGNVTLTDGTVANDLTGILFNIDQSGGIISGNAYGIYVDQDYDGTVTGSTYGIYLSENSGQDYGIYQNGVAPNYLGGAFQSQGSITTGDTDSAGSIDIWDASTNHISITAPARATDVELRLPTADPGAYDGHMVYGTTVGNVSQASWVGDKQTFFGVQSISINADAYISGTGLAYSATIGTMMPRAGSITAIGVSGLVGAGASGVDIEVWTGGAIIGAGCKQTVTQADPDQSSTFATGIYTFAAGTELQLYANFPAVNPAATLATVMVLIEFQSQ